MTRLTGANALPTATCPDCGRTDTPLMSGTFEGRVQLDAHTRRRPLAGGESVTAQCPGSFRLIADASDAARLFRTERAKIAAINATRDAIGEACVAQFPEATTGDEEPSTIVTLAEVVQRTVDEWVRLNVPRPLTLSDALAALRTAHDALNRLVASDVVPATPSDYATRGSDAFSPRDRALIDAQNDARNALNYVRDALKRSGTYENPPRP